MTLDEVIADVETQLTNRSVDAVKLALAAWVPPVAAWFLTPFGNFIWGWLVAPVIKAIAGVIIKFFDNRGYYLYKSAVNNSDASTYQDTIRDEKAAIASGDSNAIALARAQKRAAFLRLFPLTS